MNGKRSNLVLPFILAGWFPIAAATEPPELSHNPFSRPPSERTVVDRPAASGTENIDEEQDLVATMVSTSDTLANLGGHIMRPGDEVSGYSLLQVFDDHAVFLKDGERLTLYVRTDRDEERD